MPKTLPPIHPGEILLEEFLKPLEMNPHQLAMALRVPLASGDAGHVKLNQRGR